MSVRELALAMTLSIKAPDDPDVDRTASSR